MCIAYLALDSVPHWPLVIAANRDEFHARPTRAAAPWPEQPFIVGGLDLEAGGTWFAISTQGRFALLTNHRNLHYASTPPTYSRGLLCKNFLNAQHTPEQYLQQLAPQAQLYEGFNLIVGQWLSTQQRFDCWYYSNRSEQAARRLTPGHYVLSNDLLNTPWPKSQRLCSRIQQQLQTVSPQQTEAIYTILQDSHQALPNELPNTGLSPEREQLLSSPFIISPDYGTRSSTVWTVNQSGQSRFNERSFNAQGIETQRHSWPVVFDL